VNLHDPSDPPKPELPPGGILGCIDPAQFGDEQRAQLKANDDAVAAWLRTCRALGQWTDYDSDRPQ
jgi:hypothetical protein